MKYKTLFFQKWVPFLLLGTILTSCPGSGKKLEPEALMVDGAADSHHMVDFTAEKPAVVRPGGDSGINGLKLESTSGITYDGEQQAHEISEVDGLDLNFELDLRWPTMFQIAIQVDFGGTEPDATIFTATVNGKEFPFHVLEGYDYSSNLVAVQISEQFTYRHSNSVSIKSRPNVAENSGELGGPYIESIRILPQKIIATDKSLNTTLYMQFGETDLMKNTEVAGPHIWTRAYGLSETMEMIPGPTLYYRPGDLVNVKLVNKLNPDDSPALKDYEKLMERDLNPDETLAGDEARGEVNIPHNLNNTNLHVHGLHVDPSKDDVTIVIVPEGASTEGYDAPKHAHAPVDNDLGLLDSTSVSDQSVKAGKWLYSYKIPDHHLPGTHWFHPHKHGATATQVENGLAGTMVIMEADTDAIVPHPGKTGVKGNHDLQTDYDLEDWWGSHDRVFAIQEITNYGLQPGRGNNKGLKMDTIAQSSNPNSAGDQIDLTVNGIDSLVLNIQPGQLERWRFVNAGTNHRSFSQLWLAKKTKDTYPSKKPITNKNGTIIGYEDITTIVYEPVDMHLVAVDGITLPKMHKVNVNTPAFLAPGNRSDFLVNFEDEGEYVLFKNYMPTNQYISIRQADTISYSYPNKGPVTFPPAIVENQGKNNAFLFPQTGTTPTNYAGFKRNWRNAGGAKGFTKKKTIVPLIKTTPKQEGGMNYLELDFADSADFGTSSVGQFVPMNFNDAGLTDAELMWITVKKDPNKPVNSPLMPNKDWLEHIAPVTSGRAPDYVSPISNADVIQSRPVVFDVSGAAVQVKNGDVTNTINQFTLNGRFFELNDMIGNKKANEKIGTGYGDPKQFVSPTDQTNITQGLKFVPAGPIQWNTNKVGHEWYFTNPGYYQGIKLNGTGANAYYSYDGQNIPTWKDVAGISDPSLPNQGATKYSANTSKVKGMPLAKTAEEWILINNSDVSHPFHIHINPFFVVEVGQLSYERYTDANNNTKYDWFMRAATADHAESEEWVQREAMPAKGAVPGKVYKGEIGVPAVVGNWWDTIVIPSHGYVKVRYWFNVPYQTGKGANTTYVDNYNRTGIWVYHCHILRHEDRGMMMPVITMPSATEEEEE